MTIPVTLLQGLLVNLSNPAATDGQKADFVAYLGLSGSSGASSIGYKQAGTGAVETTVQTALRRTVFLQDFGTSTDIAIDAVPTFRLAVAYLNLVGAGEH